MPCTVLVGGFWGDEGKGKIISYLAQRNQISICARGGVGPNAGHTVKVGEKTYKVRMLPSAFPKEDARLLVGAGVLVNPKVLISEIEATGTEGRVGVDSQCAIIEDKHIEADKSSSHLSKKIGTTGTGTGPCNVDRVQRTVKLAKEIPELSKYIVDVSGEVNEALDAGKQVLVEGTQGTFLSLFHGTYPFCTSKDITASSICGDVGIGPTRVDEVVIVFKAYITRVGEGFLPGELSAEEMKRRGWEEFGAVTGRPRRAAPFNFDLARRAVKLNGATQIALPKIDIVYPKCRGARKFDQLTDDAKDFIKKIEDEVDVPVTIIGTGPELNEIIDLSMDEKHASK
jgi:adenylosuccinate synthase